MEAYMLIPILHFDGNCADVISLYETAFNTTATGYDYNDSNKILHAEMIIHGQKIYLNDSKNFIKTTFNVDCVSHLALTFDTSEKLLACYKKLKPIGADIIPFVKTPYSELVGNFADKFGVLWGFMVVAE
jgi:uncharacterized glyoxalase superfamily protein PhnB